ncbi:hypothetical protein DFJ74DRAFT_490102, partial [Hyaloraphidium curvatum]
RPTPCPKPGLLTSSAAPGGGGHHRGDGARVPVAAAARRGTGRGRGGGRPARSPVGPPSRLAPSGAPPAKARSTAVDLNMADVKAEGGGRAPEWFDMQEAFGDKEREEDVYDDLPYLEYISEEDKQEGEADDAGGEGRGHDTGATPKAKASVRPVPIKVAILAALLGRVGIQGCISDPRAGA